jgi:putative oxidoreductase
MLIHGVNKMLHGTQAIGDILQSAGIPPFFSFGVFLGEVIGPLLMIVGYKARIGAFLVAIDMFIAVLLVHAGQVKQIGPSGGWMIELNMLYLVGAIVVIFLGSGKYSVTKGAGPLD